MSELCPCPFCGSPEIFVNQDLQGRCWVVCEAPACGVTGPARPTPGEAAAAWNRRPFKEIEEGMRVPTTDMPEPMAPETVLPVEMASSRIGDIAAFRASEVELVEAFDRSRPCLGRAREKITGNLILVQVSGTLQGGFAWAYAKRQRPSASTQD